MHDAAVTVAEVWAVWLQAGDETVKSPFPGMDPYLEEHWRDVHHRFLTYACDDLQEHLPPDLRARLEERVYVEPDAGGRGAYPDVRVVERPGRKANTGPATEIHAVQPLVIYADSEPVTEGFIEIIDVGSGNRVVTVFELLSDTNKQPGEGQDLYRRKQREYLQGDVNLVEIDLLRSGKRVLAVSPSRIPPAYRTTYQVCVTCSSRPRSYERYRLPLSESLPAIRVPLRSTDADVLLDLQTLIDRCYHHGRYDDIDYRTDPRPPLEPADAAWARDWLSAKGMRQFPHRNLIRVCHRQEAHPTMFGTQQLMRWLLKRFRRTQEAVAMLGGNIRIASVECFRPDQRCRITRFPAHTARPGAHAFNRSTLFHRHTGHLVHQTTRQVADFDVLNGLRHDIRLTVDPRQHRVCLRIVVKSLLGTDELQRAAEAVGDVGEVAERCREVAFMNVAMHIFVLSGANRRQEVRPVASAVVLGLLGLRERLPISSAEGFPGLAADFEPALGAVKNVSDFLARTALVVGVAASCLQFDDLAVAVGVGSGLGVGRLLHRLVVAVGLDAAVDHGTGSLSHILCEAEDPPGRIHGDRVLVLLHAPTGNVELVRARIAGVAVAGVPIPVPVVVTAPGVVGRSGAGPSQRS